MLYVTNVGEGDTILVHGVWGTSASVCGSRRRAARCAVIGTARRGSLGRCDRYGGVLVAYGDRLRRRVREAAPGGVGRPGLCVVDESVEVSLALVADREHRHDGCRGVSIGEGGAPRALGAVEFQPSVRCR